ncbi:MAG: AsmA-like C-terminal region-containing protein [Verrucomicrobiota bacterium]
MKPKPASSPFRRFLRGLTNTCLLLLLPVQLTLCWIANLDHPTKLPDFLTEKVRSQLAEQGLRLQARNYWMLPDLTLAADDLSLGVDGMTGDVFTAARVEIALNPALLVAGQIEPTQVRLSGARLWCPASVARGGVRRPLIDTLTVDVTKEGRWLNLRSIQARGGKITCHLSGEVPTGLLRGEKDIKAQIPLARRLATAFAAIETAVDVAERSGGASVSLRCQGSSDGSAELAVQAVLGNDWADGNLGLIQVRGLNLRGTVKVTSDGRVVDWRLDGGAQEMAWRNLSAERLDVHARGKGRSEDTVAGLTLAQAKVLGLELRRVRLDARPIAGGGSQIDFHILSDASTASGTATLGQNGAVATTIDHALLSGEEVSAQPEVGKLLRAAGVDLRGEILLRDVAANLSAKGEFARASGEVSVSGFRGLGLSAEAISPDKALPLRTRFDFDPSRADAPLRLRDLRIASITGSADCELQAGGAFKLHLNGEIAPPSLDRVLGEWWVSLWQMMLIRENPYAIIDVESHWGAMTSVTKGRVLLNRFDFLGAPFRHVEISIDADPKHTFIGLHRLSGGDSEADGSIDGSASWDWSKPLALAGPVVRAEGNLQPWIAARCAGKDFGDALRGLSLPVDHRFTLLLTPGAKGPDIKTSIECAGAFSAWGVSGKSLQANTENVDGGMRVRAKLGLADGEAQLTLDGDPLHEAKVSLGLKACDPAQIGQLLNDLSGTKPKDSPVPAKAATAGKLDLDFAGHLNLETPRLLKGLGHYSLTDPELKKVRLLGGISTVLEALGVGATTYELSQAKGTFGCGGGRAYFPDLAITGPQARLDLAGEIDLLTSTLDFEGDFSLPRKAGFNPLDLINLNRALISLTKIKLKGPLSKPETSAIPTLKDIIKPQRDSKLGKIPDGIQE